MVSNSTVGSREGRIILAKILPILLGALTKILPESISLGPLPTSITTHIEVDTTYDTPHAITTTMSAAELVPQCCVDILNGTPMSYRLLDSHDNILNHNCMYKTLRIDQYR